MSDENKKIIEINGVKLEVDLRQARVVDSYRVGDSVKVLVKEYNSYRVNYGAIVGFVEFKNLPSIEILTVKNDGEVKFVIFNAETKDTEIAPLNKKEIQFDYQNISQILNRNINDAENRLRDAKEKKRAFDESFGVIFSE